MRKIEQQQVLDLLTTIGNVAKHGQFDDCIAGTKSILDFIEDEDAPKTKELLEKYLKTPEQQQAISEIKKSVLEELKPNKTEIVFFPYKASMWDALESIYLAAKEDPACNAFVVPIPYFDRNRDGSLGKLHYEIADYPKNIPLSDWKKYDLEERRPDAIFIHNPYDDCNLVTSVHPNYYSDKLKNFTNCLIYVPYHTKRYSIDPHLKMPDDYIWAPAFINAHKIIMQSEDARRYYIEGYKRSFGMRFGDPERKFFAGGSPKIDKVVNAKPQDFEIPQEWEKIIRRGDSCSRPRIIFYNTSIAAILNGNEEYLDKLEYVLQEVKKMKNVVLLWRPHPLSITTYESMRHILLERYLKIVENYKNEKYGIYDDTPDLNRAIALSDAYFGDASSVMTLWGFTGKPLMIQSLKFPENNIDILNRMLFSSFATTPTGEKLTWNMNGLFELNLENNTFSLITKNDKKDFIATQSFRAISPRDNGIIQNFAANDDYIMEFNSQTGEKQYIQIDAKRKINPNAGFSIVPILYNGVWYCFSSNSDSIIVWERGKLLTYQNQIYKQIGLKTKNNMNSKYLTLVFCLTKNDEIVYYDDFPSYVPESQWNWSENIYCLFSETDTILKYNLETQKITKILSHKRFENVAQAIYDGKYIWLSLREPLALMRVDLQKKSIIEFKNFPNNFQSANKSLEKGDALYIINCDDYILLFPLYANMILCFNKNAESFEEFKLLPVPKDIMANKPKYGGAFRIEKSVFVFAYFNRILYEFNLDTQKVSEHIFECTKEFYDEHFKGKFWQFESEIKPEQFYAKEGTLINTFYDFHSFMENFPEEVKGQKEAFSTLAANSDGTSGKAIYEAFCKLKTSP